MTFGCKVQVMSRDKRTKRGKCVLRVCDRTSNEVAVCTYMQAIIMALSLEDINLGKLGNF